ncbi:MAG TPA: hypothetical protein VJV96_02805 [Candidatus Angelobacter sp.]|nr:hypothetical protein [Candidatus Angelobacter sp.]
MTYKKAEIRVLGDAVTIIQTLQKVPTLGWDAVDMRFEATGTNASYDLDE